MQMGSAVPTALALLAGALVLILLVRPEITRHAMGKALTFLAFLPLPFLATWMGASTHLEHSKSTRFCVSCHVMEPYGRSLLVDDGDYLVGAHYQNKRVPRDHACFTCHTSYTMYGDLQAKIRGLRHVWVYLAGSEPEEIELYEPYQNRECLHCHGDARSFEESEIHADLLEDLESGETSCLECHAWTHGIDELDELELWEPAG